MQNINNYNIIFEKTLEENREKQKRPKLLLHVCCAPCSTSVLQRLVNDFDVTLYFSNSNIDTEDEFNKRYKELDRFINLMNYNINIIKDEYCHGDFINHIKGLENEPEGGKRCIKCFEFRLKKAFEYAELNNFEYITTTLTVSPHKNAEAINNIGNRLEKVFSVKYLYSDFKKRDGYLNSIKISKDYKIYRQSYCGCEFSK